MAGQMGQAPAAAAIGHLGEPNTVTAFEQLRDGLDPAQWTTNASTNLAVIAGPALAALRTGGVPVPTAVTVTGTEGMGAAFYPDSWTIRAAEGLYAKAQADVDAAWMRSKAIDLYHEARHAEQFFLAAKLATMRHGPLTPSEIALQGLMNGRTWELARAAAPSAPVAQAAWETVRRWIEDSRRVDGVVRDRDGARAALMGLRTDLQHDLAELPAAFTSEGECDDHQAMLLERIKQAGLLLERYVKAFDAYLNLSLERDAYAVGRMAGGRTPNARGTAVAHYQRWVHPLLDDLTHAVRGRADAFLGPPLEPADAH